MPRKRPASRSLSGRVSGLIRAPYSEARIRSPLHASYSVAFRTASVSDPALGQPAYLGLAIPTEPLGFPSLIQPAQIPAYIVGKIRQPHWSRDIAAPPVELDCGNDRPHDHGVLHLHVTIG